jgi:prepilin-type N-terminal cleavage/methylation domain-containing protein
MKKISAFSLIEVMIVVAIVSILSVLAYSALRTSLYDASLMKVEVALRKVDEAKIRYYMDTKDGGTPALSSLVGYLQVPAGAGVEVFYSKTAWETSNAATPTAGYLLQGAVRQKAQISPNAKGVPATLVDW